MTIRRENVFGSDPPRNWRERTKALGRIALVLACLCAAPNAQGEVAKEYQIKAAFLYNFTKFVEWPADRFDSPTAPIVIGVFGSDPFGGELEKAVRDRKVNGRSLSIMLLRSRSDVSKVHLLFVPAGSEKRLGAIDDASFAGVLTVTESDPLDAFSMVNFTTANDKVRFEINADAADRAGLKISAQLQKLATVVRRKS